MKITVKEQKGSFDYIFPKSSVKRVRVDSHVFPESQDYEAMNMIRILKADRFFNSDFFNDKDQYVVRIRK